MRYNVQIEEIKKHYAQAVNLGEGTRIRRAHAERLVTRGPYLGERESYRETLKRGMSLNLSFLARSRGLTHDTKCGQAS